MGADKGFAVEVAHNMSGFHDSKRSGIWLSRLAACSTLALAIWASVSVSAEEVFLFSKPLLGVYLMKGDAEERIIYRHGPHIAPRLSPDGEKILFHSKRWGRMGIWLTDLQGEEMERLCDGEQAAWSPDGKRIIFSREGRIIEKEMASGKETLVAQSSFPCEFPSYIPDGRAIFVSDGKIFIIHRDKGTVPKLLVAGKVTSAPKCSPDGKRIAYQDDAHIYMMDLAEKKISQLTMAGGVQSWPVWSQDSRSICYCQSPDAFGGPWDICHIAIDSPQSVGFVMRDVEISPDWRGSSPAISSTIELKGDNINSWQMGDNYSVEDEITVENDWGVFHLSTEKNKILIFSKETDSAQREEIELTVTNKEGKLATDIESIHVVSNDGENMVLEVCLLSEERNVTRAVFTFPRSRPFVEIRPDENVDKVYVKRDMDLAISPDRFANDLIFDPRKYSVPRILLPYAPFLIGLPDENGMILIITPSDRQMMWMVKGAEEDYFEGVEVLTGEEGIFVSLLSGADLWYQDLNASGWKIKWSSPFLAQWRTAVAGDGEYCSRMWDEEALNRLAKPALPIEGEFSGPPELSVVYVYGRSWNTPLDIVTPVDILQDALGIEEVRNILDINGLSGYRTAEEWVPLHDFLTSHENRLWPEDSLGWPQVLDFSPIFQLIIRIKMVERKGVESTTTHLCEDILNSLKGLDNRIKEYEEFLASLESLCAEHAANSSRVGHAASLSKVEHAASLFKIEGSIHDLRTKIANLSITGIEAVSDSIAAVKRCLGTGEELWDRDEFYEFRDISEFALLERQDILTKYRDFAKRVRDNAGIIVTKEPETKNTSEEIRRLAQNVLRKRYYLEGDWRGEKPLQ